MYNLRPDSHRTLTIKLPLKYCLMHFYQSIHTVWTRSTLTLKLAFKSKIFCAAQWASAWADSVNPIFFSVALKSLPKALEWTARAWAWAAGVNTRTTFSWAWAYGHAQAHDQLKVARVFTPAAHVLAHPCSDLARLRRVQIFKLFSYAESDIWI